MSFGADLKDFASSFRDTYKTFKTDWRGEYYRSELAKAQGGEKVGAAGAGNLAATGLSAGVDRSVVDTGDTPASGYNPKGKLPTFAGDDMDTVVRTVFGEAANQPPEGQQAVAATIANRSKASGRSLKAEALSPNQYEPWNTPEGRRRMLSLDPNSDTYKSIASTVKPVIAGEADPTKGATHFYAPAAQRALGRATPAWARNRPYQEIGGHRFYTLPYTGAGRDGVDRRAALDLGDEEDPDAAPVVYAAGGGVIPDSAIPDTTTAENAGSNPVTRDVMDTKARNTSSQDDDYDPRDLVDIEGARQAVAGGLKFGQRLLGLETHHAAVPEAVPPNPDGQRALAHNVGAASPEELKVVDQTIDPKGQLPPEMLEIARYNAQYKYWKSLGEDGKADRAAWSMVSAARRAATQYGAIALSIDDPKKRAEVIAKAYSRLVPDGNTMEIKGSSPQGVKFEISDPKGNLTEKGVMAVDDMVKMATGMVNGTQWLQSMVQFATAAPTNAEKALEKRSAARTEFEKSIAGTDDQDYISTLSDEQQKAYLKMDPRERKEFSQRHERRAQEEAKAQRFDERNQLQADREAVKAGNRADDIADRWARFDINRDDKAMAAARREEIQAFDMARKQGNWEAMRDDRLGLAERWQALKERDLSDRNSRLDQSLAARQKRYEEIDRRIIEKRGTKDSPLKLTAKEAAEGRRTSAIDVGADQRRMAIAGEGQEGNEFGYGGGPSPEQQTRMDAVTAGAGFNRIPEANRKFDDNDYTAIREGLGKAWTGKGVGPTEQLWASRIASDIRRSGDVSNDDAVMLTQKALDPKGPEPRVLRDGSVVLHPSLPPVRMTEESLLALAQLRGRAATPGGKPEPGRAQPATPGATAPTSAVDTGGFISPARAREAAATQDLRTRANQPMLDRARSQMPGQPAYDELRQALGEDWRQGMTYSQMQQALQDLRAERSRTAARSRMQNLRTSRPWRAIDVGP
jgi:hypothetical protein